MSKQLENAYVRHVSVNVRLLPSAYAKVKQAITILNEEGYSTSYADFCKTASIEKAEKIIKKANNVNL